MDRQCHKSYLSVIQIENRFKFYEVFIKNYNKDSDIGYFLKVDVQYPTELHEIHNELPFILERMKTEEAEKTCSQLV